jgi:protease IV
MQEKVGQAGDGPIRPEPIVSKPLVTEPVVTKSLYSPIEDTQPMQTRTWEYLAWAGFLVLCLVAGLLLARLLAPQPLVGVVRFAAAIDFTTTNQLVNLIEEARQDDQIAAVVLEITSPGGYATSSESIYYSLLKLREQKPLVVVIDGLAVSGGYYMAAAANRIYAPSSSYVGNIGTRGPRPSDPYLTPDELSSGPYKLSGGDRFDRIRQLDLVAEAFIQNVVHQRKHSVDNPLTIDAETISEARIYLGSEAVAIGMVDYEGGRTDAIMGAAELAGVHNYGVVDLWKYLNQPATFQLNYQAAVKQMVETAPPGVIFLLDSRIPLPGIGENSEVDRHLMRLRSIAPASLSDLPATEQKAQPAPAQIGDQ